MAINNVPVSVYSVIMVGFPPRWYYTFDPMLLPWGNPFKCHEEGLYYLQPMILPKRFDIFSPLTGGCSEGLDAFIFFFKQQ